MVFEEIGGNVLLSALSEALESDDNDVLSQVRPSSVLIMLFLIPFHRLYIVSGTSQIARSTRETSCLTPVYWGHFVPVLLMPR